VMSLPVSAFAGVDDDGDGRLSVAELRTHQANIIARVHHGIALWEETGARPLQGLMVNLASPDESPATPSAQLMVLGRFALAAQDQSLRLRVDLFGTTPGEQTFQVKVLRGGQAQWLVFSPAQPEHGLFAPKWELFLSFTQWGALHIFAGFDHLLFALVVLVGTVVFYPGARLDAGRYGMGPASGARSHSGARHCCNHCGHGRIRLAHALSAAPLGTRATHGACVLLRPHPWAGIGLIPD
jgi:hypothetical protein